MPASLKHGHVQVEVSQINGCSAISFLKQRMPLRISHPLYPAGQQTVSFFIMNPAAGLLQGDRHTVYIRIKAGAQAVIMGQGATKVFRSPQRSFSRQFTTICVEAGARLEYLPDVVIPYAASCLLSRTNILLADGASALFWEINAPGRLARQECFSYHKLDQQTNIYSDRQLIFSDRFVLEPAKVPEKLRSWHHPLGILHGYSHSGTFWAIDAHIKQELGPMLRTDTGCEGSDLERIAGQYGVLLAGTKITDRAYCFRALGYSADAIQAAFKEIWLLCRKRLFHQPAWPWRKY